MLFDFVWQIAHLRRPRGRSVDSRSRRRSTQSAWSLRRKPVSTSASTGPTIDTRSASISSSTVFFSREPLLEKNGDQIQVPTITQSSMVDVRPNSTTLGWTHRIVQTILENQSLEVPAVLIASNFQCILCDQTLPLVRATASAE